MKIFIIIFSLLISNIVHARCDENVERTYDFSERVILKNKPNSFLFEHCVLNKCQAITSEMPRDITIAQFQSFMGSDIRKLDSIGWQNTQFVTDALSNYKASPEKRTVQAFGYSKTPERHDVWCGSLKLKEFLDSVKDADRSEQFALKYKGTCNKFCEASGDSSRAITTMPDVIRGIKNLEKNYLNARKGILASDNSSQPIAE